MNLYKVKVKDQNNKDKIVYVRSFSFSEVESYILSYILKGTKTMKKFKEIISINKIGDISKETLLDTF